jgi:hypothetical protein
MINYTPSPTSELFHNDRSQVKCIMGPVGCLSSEHEVMTRDGWIGIAEWSGQDILVADTLGVTHFEQPRKYISAPCDWLYRFKFRDATMEVSSDHKMLYRSDRAPHFAKGPATALAAATGEGLPDWLGKGWYIPAYEGDNIYIDDGYTAEQFHPADKMQYCFEVSTSLFVTRFEGRSVITGNSGKSVTCVMECLFHAINMPAINGIRHSRIGIVRSTYSELKETTIKTFDDWLGSIGKFRYDSPIKFNAKIPLADGTVAVMHVSFFPLDQPKDVKRLRSSEYTMLWLNEGSLIETDFLSEISGRLRYMSRIYGDAFKAGTITELPYRPIIIDTNPPSNKHWIYKKFEEEKLSGYRMFKQPSGLIKAANGSYEPNPLAENVGNFDIGYQYYYNMMVGMTQDKINVLVLGQYGSTFEGMPVYESSWLHSEHVSDEPLLFNRTIPLVIGMDWGMSPAASFMQMSPTGQLLILDELAPHDVTLEQFIVEHLRPKLMNRFPGANPIIIGDPAGAQRSSLSTQNAFEVVRSFGYMVESAPTQDPVMRREAVTHFLLRRSAQGALLRVSRQHCPVTIEGFDGGYKFAKLPAGLGHKVVPDKNSYSHVHDATQYGALYYYGDALRQKKARERSRPAAPTSRRNFA